MTLELKHLAPYLPYGLEYIATDSYNNKRQMDLSTDFGKFKKNIYKPILRPLADLKGKDYDLIRSFEACTTDELNDVLKQCPECLTYESILYLFEWHFDVFRLIEKGLAIDINTLNS